MRWDTHGSGGNLFFGPELQYVRTFRGVPAKFPDNFEAHIQMDLLFAIPEFRNLVMALANTWYAVPAPLNVFAGLAQLRLRGHGEPLREKEIFPIDFETSLKSPEQKMVIDTEGKLRLTLAKNAFAPEAEVEVQLTDVQLALPNVVLAGLPQLLPDSRIKPKAPSFDTEKKGGKFRYQVHVVTTPDKPARLLSHSNTQIAMTDRALSLASLYILGSTPIKSVRYDPINFSSA